MKLINFELENFEEENNKDYKKLEILPYFHKPFFLGLDIDIYKINQHGTLNIQEGIKCIDITFGICWFSIDIKIKYKYKNISNE